MKVLVDHMNFVFVAFHAIKKDLIEKGIEEFTEDNIGLFFHSLFNKYNTLFKTYGSLIICHEGMSSLDWRRNIYPDYKRNRDEGKKDPSYLVLKSTFDTIEKALSYYPCKQIKVDYAEADDVIFALATYYANKGEKVIIISTDGDLTQIMDYSENIMVYNPIKKVFIPKKENLVLYKAIVGDKSDNIPGVNRIGEKTFEKMLNDKNLWNEKLKNGNYEVFQMFLKIVDLSKFPKEKHDEIVNIAETIEYSTFNIPEIERFFFENKMQDHLFRWGSDYGEIVEKINSSNDNIKIINSIDYNSTINKKNLKNSKDEEIDDVLKDFL